MGKVKALVEPPRPLAKSDDRESFDCGRDSLNSWFRRHAWINQINNVSRVTVLTEKGTGQIVGYFTLSATQIERALLPKPQQRNRPDPAPAILLGQLAVDRKFQGQGHATDLLLQSFRYALAASQHIGAMAVLTHPLDDKVRGFYARWVSRS
jgi:GNAT superfamily N-acetyltransferase